MNTHSIKDIANSADRFKIYVFYSSASDLDKNLKFIQSEGISTVNVGHELAAYVDSIDDYSYLTYDVQDFTRKMLDKNKSKINGIGNDILAIYNLGIFLEPALELNAIHLLKEFSKSSALIIIWENESEIPDRLNWPTQKNNVYLDFSDVLLKKMRNEV